MEKSAIASPRGPATGMTVCVYNVSRQSFLSLSVSTAGTHLSRLRGLLGRVRLRGDEGLWIVPCNGIHTIGMLFPIDVIYLDADNRVIHVCEHFGPFRVAGPRAQCASILELPVRTIYSSNTRIGDKLLIASPEQIERHLRAEHPIQAPPARDRKFARPFSRRKLRERRQAPRIQEPGLLAYYWDGAAPASHRVREISVRGACIETPLKWYRGTMIDIVIQHDDPANGTDACSLHCCVVKPTADGVGVQFVHESKTARRELELFLLRTQLRRQTRTGREAGNSLLEFALVLPLLLLLIINVVNFGAYFYAHITVANAARTGAQYMTMAGASVGAPDPPATETEIKTKVVNREMSSLTGSFSVDICKANNDGGCAALDIEDNDPESTHYVLAACRITYAYQPVLPDFSVGPFHTTLPAAEIKHTAVMRMLQ